MKDIDISCQIFGISKIVFYVITSAKINYKFKVWSQTNLCVYLDGAIYSSYSQRERQISFVSVKTFQGSLFNQRQNAIKYHKYNIPVTAQDMLDKYLFCSINLVLMHWDFETG